MLMDDSSKRSQFAGIEFIDENGDGAAVHFGKR
jgi:hypothetical protein